MQLTERPQLFRRTDREVRVSASMWECSSGGLHVFIVFEFVTHHQGLGKLSFKTFQEALKYQ